MIQRLIERVWQAQLLAMPRSVQSDPEPGTQSPDRDLLTWMIETQIYGWMR